MQMGASKLITSSSTGANNIILKGSYYLDWYDDAKRQRRCVGTNALRAEAEYRQAEQKFAAKAASLKAGLKIVE